MRHPLDSDGLKHLASENYFSDFYIICWIKQSNMVIINRNKKNGLLCGKYVTS